MVRMADPTRNPVTRLRTALIGCGKVGSIHAAALRDLPESEVVAVCDASADRAGVFAATYGGRPYTDVAAMLRESGAQAAMAWRGTRRMRPWRWR